MADWHHPSDDYHELPEFLRFNRYGGVLTHEERLRVAKTKGACPKCGISTHRVTPFRSVPLDNGDVRGGICLKCNPNQRRIVKHPPIPLGAKKAAKILGRTSQLSPDAVVRSKGVVRKVRKNKASNIQPPPLTRRDDREQAQPFNQHVTFDPPPVSPGGKAAKLLGHGEDSSQLYRRNSDKSSSGLSRSLVKRIRPPRAKNSRLSSKEEEDEEEDDNLFDGTLNFDVPAAQPRKNALSKSVPPREDSNTRRDSLLGMHHVYNSSPNNFRTENFSREHLLVREPSDAWDLVKEMRSQPENVELLTRKCHELRDIGTNFAGSLYEIIDVMRRHPVENQLQIACIGALWSLSADVSDENTMEILDAGGAEMVIKALKYFRDDLTLLSWGMGALSNFGEGIGGRAYLEEEGIVNVIEQVLKMLCKNNNADGRGMDVLYWVFRCLVMLICDFDDAKLAQDHNNSDDLEEDLKASGKSMSAIAEDTEIIRLALLAIKSTNLDGITMEIALKFLSHFDIDSYIGEERFLLTGACEHAIQIVPHDTFPILHHIACAIMCFTMKMDSLDNEDDEVSGVAKIFVGVALDDLTSQWRKQRFSLKSNSQASSSRSQSSRSLHHALSYSVIDAAPHKIVDDVMVCTLSHLLCFGNATLSFAGSNEALQICCSILQEEETSVFLRGSCFWITWIIFHCGYGLGATHSSKAASALQLAMPSIEHSPTLLAVGFAALSEVAKYINIEAGHLVETIVRLVSKYSNVEMMCIEAYRLLFNLCKGQESAALIISAGGLGAVTTHLNDSKEPCPMALHLLIKLSVIADNDLLSVQDHEAMINASKRMKHISSLAAKSWVGFLASSIALNKKDNAKSAPRAIACIDSIRDIMEAFPKNVNLQRLGLMALRNMAVTIQAAQKPLDISMCIRLVLNAQKEHGVQIHKNCCDTLWALMGVQCELDSTLSKEIVYFAIEVMETCILSSEYEFDEFVVSGGMAIFADTFLRPVDIVHFLGEKIVDIVVNVVNTAIYSCLDNKRDHPLIFEFGFCTLRRLCSDDSSRGIIVNHGGVVAVVDGMMSNLENASIQENGCNILWRLSGNDLGMKLNIVEADGVDVIMNVMISHGENASVLAEAFQALSCLSVDRTSRNFIAQQGGVMVIASSMSSLDKSVAVQEAGLAALCNIASDVDEDILDASNIISVVNSSLYHHAKNANVQRKGLALLYNLSIRGEGMKSKLLSSGALTIITKAVKNHTNSSKVVASALRILQNLSNTDECMMILLEKTTITLIIHAMMLHIENLKNAIIGCKILWTICEMSPKFIVIGLSGVEAIVCAMMVHYSSEYIQDMGCCILACSSSHLSISNDGDFNTDVFDLICKIVKVILSAMSGFPDSLEVQNNATTALRNMSKIEENIAVLNTEQVRVEVVLTQTMKRFPECQKFCLEVLEVLAM